MRIYLIRHGETTGDVEDRYGGDYDDSLTEKGRKQASELAERLEDSGIEVIYHSPKLRAKETAEILNKKVNAKMVTVNDLRERNHCGVLTGLTKKEAREKYPEQVEEFAKGKLHHNVEGSESYEHFKERMLRAFDNTMNSHYYHTIAIVTHGGPISCFFREVLRLGEFKFIGDCALFEIENKAGELSVIMIENADLE